MIDEHSAQGSSSGNPLESLAADRNPSARNYRIVVQNAEEVQNVENAPAVSMWPYLLQRASTQLFTKISIYSQRGETREQMRLLYMNATAIQVWEEMGKQPRIIGSQHRPPPAAALAFGVPFSE